MDILTELEVESILITCIKIIVDIEYKTSFYSSLLRIQKHRVLFKKKQIGFDLF